ncbi:16S rRNA (cytidine(1402)-2'-O)-methyltransferase [Candidatus Roizmanbacteria bacterium]|nr:16S rRNA (cytidine(1402)-2'-O)-methyltransferase [Candidatus Roizmanbacteria bacterium]
MLYIVATPIGNLDDLSVRQAKTLVSSDVILAEDTRSAQVLISAIKERFSYQFKPNLKIVSYYKEKEFEKLHEIIAWLKEDKDISLISESGIPLISDPGYLLVKTAIKQNIPVTVIPGPSAIITGLIYSGFNPKEFMFLGFFPKKESEITRLINKLIQVKKVFPDILFIFFESPNRITPTLKLINKLTTVFDVVICRELTKKFEEIVRGNIRDLTSRNYKGELTIIMA